MSAQQSRKIFVNLPVSDLARATAFYEAIGASRNPQFSDGTNANAMTFSDAISVMLLTHAYFQTFTPKKIADARAVSETLVCISADSREAVDAIVAAASDAGGRPDIRAPQDHGFMYGRSIEDPDGHIWEVMWMDVEAAKASMPGTA